MTMRSSITGYLDLALRVIGRALAVMLAVVVIVFLLLRFAPGDPIMTLLGQGATRSATAALRAKMGLDQPIVLQLFHYLARAATGDLGTSLVFQRPALDLVAEAFPWTLLLSAAAFAIVLITAIPLGIASALLRGTRSEAMINVAMLFLQAMPPFWVGIMLIHIFALRLQLLPTSGTGTWENLVLPAITLSMFQIALTVRTLRSSMLEAMKEDFVRTARAKGLSKSRIVLRHVLFNALGPVITVMALQLGTIFSGAIITEAVFSWPGIGSLALGALLSRDYTLAQAIVIVSALIVVLLNIGADVLIAMIDPRMRGASMARRRANS